ncbi:hypothetical protein [Shewanella colwelliana]|uniref:hypothetical protein n=1 Tax=Shewanella colwelliana TaxID=23 RepID=UPI003736F34A
MRSIFRLVADVWQLNIIDDDYWQARLVASRCIQFCADDEDEQVDDTLRSCVNCTRRRWLVNGITCTAAQ